jgi:hypothetical protein
VAAFPAAALPATAAGAPPTSCFWTDTVSSTHNNILLPDAAATYWYSRFVLPPGGKVVLHGRYPHSRSFFTWAYDLETPADGLNDATIEPDRDAINPFIAGAARTAAHRSYTLTIATTPPPGPGEPRQANTIYAGARGLTGLPQTVRLLHRVYLPDAGRDATGDAGLPAADFVSANGVTLAGEAACDALQNDGAKIPNITMLAAPLHLALLALSRSPTHPAVTPTRWYPLLNPDRLTEPYYAGTAWEWLIGALPRSRRGPGPSAHPEADSGFIYSHINRSFGSAGGGNNVLVLRGKLPTTPRTFRGAATMQRDTQMRYWSLCQYDSFPSGRVGDCLYDEEVPTDPQGFYTIVVSLPVDRPANATGDCGVAWLDWGTMGDGFFRPRAGLLLIRNQLPDPSFGHAAQDIDVAGTERSVMQDYFPTGSYLSTTQFESRGCHGALAKAAVRTGKRRGSQ